MDQSKNLKLEKKSTFISNENFFHFPHDDKNLNVIMKVESYSNEEIEKNSKIQLNLT